MKKECKFPSCGPQLEEEAGRSLAEAPSHWTIEKTSVLLLFFPFYTYIKV